MNIMYPTPRYYQESSDKFVFTDKLYFIIDRSFSNEGFKSLCQTLWKNFTAGKCELEVVEKENIGKAAVISLSEDALPVSKDTEYEYEVYCDKNSVNIQYSEDVGLIHAFCSVLQLIGPYRRKTKDHAIVCASIKDKPALKLRGIHLCLFKETPMEDIKRFVVVCGFLKVSHIIIESWGGLKFDTMKELAWPNAYTKDDLKEVIFLGKALGVEFIPFFNHLGHAPLAIGRTGLHTVLDQNPEYEEWFKPGGWAWDVDNEEVIEMQRKLRAEICELFGEGEYFHIGCDEIADMVGIWDDDDTVTESDGFVRFLNRTADDIKENINRKPIMWGDMFLDITDFRWPFCGNTNEDIFYDPDNLTKDMYIVDWQYNINEDKDESVKYFLKYVDPSHLILSPWQEREKIRGRVNLAKKYKLLGVLGTTWNAESKLGDMIYTSCCMWEEDDSPYEFDYSSAGYRNIMMRQHMRKLLPKNFEE